MFQFAVQVVEVAELCAARGFIAVEITMLVPSFIVGFYGQNFAGQFSEEYWSIGFSTGLIVASTLVQLALFRWRRWI